MVVAATHQADVNTLLTTVQSLFGDKLIAADISRGELTLQVAAANYLDVAVMLRDAKGCQFEVLIDLCAVDYSEYKQQDWQGARFCVVLHLLSLSLNQRLRLKVFAPDDEQPILDSVTSIWNAANWFEREAFDLYGVVFSGHNDLRRILTDYGFIGHPFRKDFPLSGHMEMTYNTEQKRVVYQPVSIEPREITPRVIREDDYGGLH